MFNPQPNIKIDFRNKKYPYKLCNDVVYTYENTKIRIKHGYNYDGCTIPRFFYRIIGSKGEVEFLRAALLHDVLCERKKRYTNKFATKVFRDELINSYCPVWKANIMAFCVYWWQEFCGGWKK